MGILVFEKWLWDRLRTYRTCPIGLSHLAFLEFGKQKWCLTDQQVSETTFLILPLHWVALPRLATGQGRDRLCSAQRENATGAELFRGQGGEHK